MPSSCQTTSKSKHYDFRTVCLTMTKGDKRSLLADGCCSTLQVYVFYIMYNEAVTGVANGIEDAPFRRTAGWCCLVVHTNEFHYNVVGWTIGKITFSRRSRMKSTTVITHKKKIVYAQRSSEYNYHTAFCFFFFACHIFGLRRILNTGAYFCIKNRFGFIICTYLYSYCIFGCLCLLGAWHTLENVYA